MGSKNRQGCCCGCKVRFFVAGCFNLPLFGAVVSVWSDSSKTTSYGSGVTDVFGVLELTLPVSSGSWYFEISHPTNRLATVSGTSSCIPGGTRGVLRQLATVKPGFHCTFVCGLPAPETLHYSDELNGSVTLVYGAGGYWQGQTTTDFPGGTDKFGGHCEGTSAKVVIAFNATAIATVAFGRNGQCADGSVTTLNPVAALNIQSQCMPNAFACKVQWFPYQINPVQSKAYVGIITE